MKVTQIYVIPIKGYPRMRASVNIVLDEVLKVKDIHIIAKRKGDGVDVIFPERRTSNGDYFAITYPINKEFRKEVVKAILDEYYRVLNEKGKPATKESSVGNSSEESPIENSDEADDSEGANNEVAPDDEPDLD